MMPFRVSLLRIFFQALTLPFLEQETFHIDWVFNILDHKKESETIVVEDDDPDTGFVMVPDYKVLWNSRLYELVLTVTVMFIQWNGKQVEDLYLIVLTHDRAIRSIRELSGEHLPLLKNIWNKGCKGIMGEFSFIVQGF